MVILIIVVVLVALALWYFMKSGYKLPQQTAEGPAIVNAQDLDETSRNLDNVDLNQMDPELNQLGRDSSSF